MRVPFLFSDRASGASSETGRLEAFSDGIFSIAITLLGFQLIVPAIDGTATNSRLWSGLLDHWPSYVSFVLSFTSILIMWINHHAIFSVMARMDKLVMVTNGVLLLFVTAVPFATMVVDEYLRTDASSTAVALYGGLFVAINLSYNVLWWTIVARHRLLDPRVDERWVRSYSIGLLTALPLYLFATIIAFWSIPLSIAIVIMLWLYWSLTPFDPTIREP